MITAEKLKIFEEFDGDLDMWGRVHGKRDSETMSESDWRQIEQLVSELTLVERNLATDDFARRVEASLRENTEDDNVATRIRCLATGIGVSRPKRWWKFW